MAGDRKRVTARTTSRSPAARSRHLGHVVEQTPGTVVLEVPRSRAGAVVGSLELLDDVSDVSLGDPPLEETLRDLYRLSP